MQLTTPAQLRLPHGLSGAKFAARKLIYWLVMEMLQITVQIAFTIGKPTVTNCEVKCDVLTAEPQHMVRFQHLACGNLSSLT